MRPWHSLMSFGVAFTVAFSMGCAPERAAAPTADDGALVPPAPAVAPSPEPVLPPMQVTAREAAPAQAT